MKLYGSVTSPYARKVRMAIMEKQLAVEFIAVDSPSDARIAARNPLGKVPVFERDDGTVLFDSPVIIEYLDSLSTPALIPAGGEARWQVLRWAALADGILDATVTRVMESRRPEALRSADAMQHQEGKIARALDFAEREFKGEPWLVAKHLTLADIAVASALGYVDFRYPHDWRSAHPRLTAWHAAMEARPAFVATRPPAAK